MSDIKEIDIKFKIGDMTAEHPGHHGKLSLLSGAAEANKVWAELQGKFGEDFDNKPVIVIGSEDAESLKNFLETLEGFEDIGGPSNEEFKQHKEAFLKPVFKRVGDEVIITRQESLDELAPFLAGFQDVLDGNVSFDFSLESDKTPGELCEAKKNILYMMHNGARGSFNLRVSLAFLERAFEMGTQFAPVPEPELAKSMLNFFKKFTLNFETFDVNSLPNELKEIFDHPMIEEILNPFNEMILGKLKERFLPILEKFQEFSKIKGPIRFYYPIRDTLAVKMEANAVSWFDAAYQMLSA
jgi:hypothetical protein